MPNTPAPARKNRRGLTKRARLIRQVYRDNEKLTVQEAWEKIKRDVTDAAIKQGWRRSVLAMTLVSWQDDVEAAYATTIKED